MFHSRPSQAAPHGGIPPRPGQHHGFPCAVILVGGGPRCVQGTAPLLPPERRGFAPGLGVFPNQVQLVQGRGKIPARFQRLLAGPRLGRGPAPTRVDEADGRIQVAIEFAAEEVGHGAERSYGAGRALDPLALAVALRVGKLAGAGLDAFANEPPVGSPLLDLENIVLTPHIGGRTLDGQRRMGEMVIENCLRALRGEPPLYQVK